MNLCFIASANSVHMKKWCKWFFEHGHTVHVISFEDGPGLVPYAEIYSLFSGFDASTASSWNKLRYLTQGCKIRKLVDEIQPDVVNVHYASSYGVATALSGINNYVLSLWGSDVYDFPRHSFFHRKLLEFSLRKANLLFSTSKVMATEAMKYTDKSITITPFGVDTILFRPQRREKRDTFVLGTIKTLTAQSGVDHLLHAAAFLMRQRPDIPLRLRIAGCGQEEDRLKVLARDLGINDFTDWLGWITPEQAATEWANFDVAVIVSDLESFGVSAVEAQACGTPVIVSDAPGLLESTCPEKSSLVVPRKDERALADAILRLYQDETLRVTMGNYGRNYVQEHFDLTRCFEDIEKQFELYIAQRGSD